jgi:hypothetical protein
MGSNITGDQDVRDVVLLSISECNKQIAEIQRTRPPDDDETLRTAVLLSFETPTTDGIRVWIGISNVKNEEATVLVPLLVEG